MSFSVAEKNPASLTEPADVLNLAVGLTCCAGWLLAILRGEHESVQHDSYRSGFQLGFGKRGS